MGEAGLNITLGRYRMICSCVPSRAGTYDVRFYKDDTLMMSMTWAKCPTEENLISYMRNYVDYDTHQGEKND